jgi:hypothetical protein
MEKIDIRNYHLEALMSLINANREIRMIFSESENWQELFVVINNAFTYSNDQLEYVKSEFDRKKNSEIKPSLLTKK